jgi:hypothetical protein
MQSRDPELVDNILSLNPDVLCCGMLCCAVLQVRIILNKSDQVDQQQLMRVYGALMWSLGKVFKSPEVCKVGRQVVLEAHRGVRVQTALSPGHMYSLLHLHPGLCPNVVMCLNKQLQQAVKHAASTMLPHLLHYKTVNVK